MDKLYRIELVVNQEPSEPTFTAVVYGNGGPTDFKSFPGNAINLIFGKVATYIEEKIHA